MVNLFLEGALVFLVANSADVFGVFHQKVSGKLYKLSF